MMTQREEQENTESYGHWWTQRMNWRDMNPYDAIIYLDRRRQALEVIDTEDAVKALEFTMKELEYMNRFIEIKKLKAQGVTNVSLANTFNVHPTRIANILYKMIRAFNVPQVLIEGNR